MKELQNLSNKVYCQIKLITRSNGLGGREIPNVMAIENLLLTHETIISCNAK